MPAGDFRMIVDRAAAAGRFDPIDRANGGLVDWPGGAAPYAYGAYFHQYLADRFGPESLVRLVGGDGAAAPLLRRAGVSKGVRAIARRAVGRLRGGHAGSAARRRRHDRDAADPSRVLGGRARDSAIRTALLLDREPARLSGADGAAARRLGAAPGDHDNTSAGGSRRPAGWLVFDQLELVANVALQSDLYSVAAGRRPHAPPDPRRARGRSRRLSGRPHHRLHRAVSRSPRAGDASLDRAGADDAAGACSSRRSRRTSRRRGGRRTAVRLPPSAACSAVRRRSSSIDSATGRARAIAASPDGRNVSPFWLPDGTTILFASDRGGKPFAIYSRRGRDGPDAAARTAPAPARNRQPCRPTAASSCSSATRVEGYDLFSMPMDAADVDATSSRARRAVAPAAGIAPVRPARTRAGSAVATVPPWRTLAPRYWTPIVESDNGEIVSRRRRPSGADALGRHAYVAGVGWSASRAAAGLVVRLHVRSLVADDVRQRLRRHRSVARRRGSDAGAERRRGVPVRRVRWTQAAARGVHADRATRSTVRRASRRSRHGGEAPRAALRLELRQRADRTATRSARRPGRRCESRPR